VRLTTIVETTHVVDPAHVGGHLLYAARYTDPLDVDFDQSLEDLQEIYLRSVRRVFPAVNGDTILGAVVQRARVVEPVHLLGGAKNVPEVFVTPRIALASTAHVYPEIVSGQAVIGVAERVAAQLLERLPAAERVAA